MLSECMLEPELWEEIASGRWPAASSAELRRHVEACAGCRELAVSATTIRDDRRATEPFVAVPQSGGVWFRVQLRAKREQKEAAARLVRRTHASLIALTVIATLIALSVTSVLSGGWGWIKGAAADFASVPALPPMPIILLIAVPLVLMSAIAAYFVFSDVERETSHPAKR